MFGLRNWFSARGVEDPTQSALLVEANSPALITYSQLIEAIGIETTGGAFTPILKVRQRLPCSITRIFSTAIDGQTEITFNLYRGNNITHVSSGHPLGTSKIEGIPPQPRGVAVINIRLFTRAQDLLLDARYRNGKHIRVVRVE
jgi:molecular chaperone DnaK (HSP70)